MSFQTSIAFHLPTQTIKSVNEVERGLKCDCICEDCSDKLEKVERKIPKRISYFRHSNKSNCKGSFESLLHRYAKQIIVESHTITGLNEESIIYKSAVSESSLNIYRPDVTLSLENGENIYIEIFVTNEVKEIKSDFYVQNKYKSFEIDLSELNDLVSPEEIRDEVLFKFENRTPLYWPELMVQKKIKNNESSNWVVWVGSLVAAFLFYRIFCKKK